MPVFGKANETKIGTVRGAEQMPAGRQKSYLARPADVKREWIHVDASGQVLGRLAVKIANVLMGKHKPTYTPHVDTGDYVVVTNADKFKLTGRKLETMHYDRYTYHYGGFRSNTIQQVLQRHPERVIEYAVRRMMPKTAMGARMMKKLKVYKGAEHPHTNHAPKAWS